jgi:DNA-binding SARP family transcriptional activator
MLGELEISSGEEPLPPLESRRAESLLAFLLVRRGTRVAREQLAFLLWPDSTEQQARTNLRHVLHTLRRALPELDAFIDVTARTLEWRADAPCQLDLAAFEAALASGEDAEAVRLYRGDLLAGRYDDWVLAERERLRGLQLAALERVCATLEAEGRLSEAIGWAERLVAADPLREDAYRRLMRLHDARGDRARALSVYHGCAATLERELGVDPSPATRAAYEALLPGVPDAAASGRAPLVGRAAERARLTERWRASEAGRAQLVIVTGEPGVGKTRLVEELREWCAHRGAATAEGRSYRAEGALAYGPVVAWLRAEAFLPRRVRLDRGRLSELARVLPELSGVPAPLPEPEARRRLFDALAAALLGAPALLVADDLHWADRETLRFLHYLLRSHPDAPVLVAATARRGDMEPLKELLTGLTALDCVTELELGPLSRRETAVLAERLGGDADAERLYDETEGNPLFVVETLRAGSRSPRVRAVIEARFAQLSPPAGALVGVAAAVGREFTSDVLARAAELDEPELVRGLDELWRRRIVRERGPDGYDFSHDKLREVAYRTLGPARRRRTHLLIAEALAELQPAEPGQVAQHYDRAGAAAPAAEWYERAAAAAQRMHAGPDAIRALERALALGAPELRVILGLVPLLAFTDGLGSPRLAELLERARQLEAEPSPTVLRAQALVCLARGDFAGASRCGEELHARGEAEHDGVLLVESHYVHGVAAFWQGELTAARRHFEAAIAGYRPEHRADHIVRFGLDPRVVCMSRLANTLAFLGEPDAARAMCDAALATAAETADATSTATALVFAAVLALDLDDIEEVRRLTPELVAAGREVKPCAMTGQALEGYLAVLDGQPAAGLARVRAALEAAPETDHAPGHRASLARILLAAGVAAGDAETVRQAAERVLGAGAGAPLWGPEARRRLEELSRNAARS